jgi:hypothetical protein
MREEKERFLDRARRKAAEEPQFAAELGVMLLTGIEEVIQMETYAGSDLHHSYVTHFPVPGDGDWTFTIARREVTDAR